MGVVGARGRTGSREVNHCVAGVYRGNKESKVGSGWKELDLGKGKKAGNEHKRRRDTLPRTSGETKSPKKIRKNGRERGRSKWTRRGP